MRTLPLLARENRLDVLNVVAELFLVNREPDIDERPGALLSKVFLVVADFARNLEGAVPVLWRIERRSSPATFRECDIVD